MGFFKGQNTVLEVKLGGGKIGSQAFCFFVSNPPWGWGGGVWDLAGISKITGNLYGISPMLHISRSRFVGLSNA